MVNFSSDYNHLNLSVKSLGLSLSQSNARLVTQGDN